MGASGRKRGDSQAGRRRARRRGSRSSSRRSPFVTGGCHCRTRSGGGGGPGAARAALQHGSAGSGTARPGRAQPGLRWVQGCPSELRHWGHSGHDLAHHFASSGADLCALSCAERCLLNALYLSDDFRVFGLFVGLLSQPAALQGFGSHRSVPALRGQAGFSGGDFLP